ncbi:MAG: glutathione S-transferase family protein, partial [Rhizomicrobium sp.]
MITLYHAPRSRSSRIIWLLEELGAEYKIELVPIVRGDGTGTPAPDSYLAIHP